MGSGDGMDIIAAHRQGLTEKLDVECADLAGRERDFGQRAIVLHHIYDHSQGTHWWALIEAGRQMATDRALQALDVEIGRWWHSRARRAVADDSLLVLRRALGAEGARRTAAAYRAYRMAGTPALSDGLTQEISPDHAAGLIELHAERRLGRSIDADRAAALAEAVEQDVGSDPDGAVAAALLAIDRSFLRRRARREWKAPPLADIIARQRKRGWDKLERALREDPFLPAAFHANPAQHFFALQHGLADRRRKDWLEGESALAA